MSIASVTGFVIASLVFVAIALGVLVVSVGVAATEYFVENRPVRLARNEDLIPYYRRRLALA